MSEETLAKKDRIFVNIFPQLHINTDIIRALRSLKTIWKKKMPNFSFIETNKSITMKTKPCLKNRVIKKKDNSKTVT